MTDLMEKQRSWEKTELEAVGPGTAAEMHAAHKGQSANICSSLTITRFSPPQLLPGTQLPQPHRLHRSLPSGAGESDHTYTLGCGGPG